MSRRGAAALSFASGMALISAGAAAAARAAALPYNVRELFGSAPLRAAAALALIAYWVFGAPAVLAAALARARASRAFLLAAVVPIHAALTYAAVRLAVPIESVYDVVGSPVLHWPWELELLGRFTALLGAIVILWTGSAACAGALAGNRGSGRAIATWGVWAAALLPVAHVVVVTRAATDNLTELMAGGGGVAASLWIATAVFCVGLAGSALARLGAGGRPAPLGAAVLLSLPLAYIALSLGLERHVEKYGQTFSALQFLLSRDRASLAGAPELMARYVAAHVAAVGLLALAQHPVALLSPRAPRTAARAPAPGGAPPR